MEGRRTPTGSVSPLHYRAPKGSVSPLHSQSTPKRSASPFYNRNPTASASASVSPSNYHTSKRSASPLHSQTPKGSVSPLRAPKGSVSPLPNQTSKRSVSPLLGQRPKGSVSPLHSSQIPRRSPSPLHSQTPKRSVSPFLGKTPKDSVSSLYSRTSKGSVSPFHDKTPKQSVSPSPSQASKGLVSPLHSQTPKRAVSPFQYQTPKGLVSPLHSQMPKRSVSPFQYRTPKGSVSPLHSQMPKRSVSPFQHQTSKRAVSPLHNQMPKRSVSPLPYQAPTFSNSPSQNQETTPSDLEELPKDSVSPSHSEEKTQEGSVSPIHTQEKPSSKYLKAPSGTCHDICKYGLRNNLEEEKGKHVVTKSFNKAQNHGERRKKTVIKLRSLSSGKIVFSEKIELNLEEYLFSNEEGREPVEWQDIKSYDDASVPSTETQTEGGEIVNTNSDVESTSVERRNKKKQVLKSKESNGRNTSEKRDLCANNKTDSKKKPDNMKENTSLHERKATASAKPKLVEVSDENLRKPGKSKFIGKPTQTEMGNTNDTCKHTASKAENSPKKKLSLFTILRGNSGRKNYEGKSEKTFSREKKVTTAASTSSHSETKEKVLHMIEPKPRKITSKPRVPKSTEEQDVLKPEKANFRRGKAVEVPPDPGTPKKLRSRKGRRSNESQGGFQIGRRSFRRRGSISAGSSNPHGQVVVLRHCETEEKKGIQGLFNSIIEETVNKLVKTRKSKVKALVGAFETVISLQDGKSVSME